MRTKNMTKMPSVTVRAKTRVVSEEIQAEEHTPDLSNRSGSLTFLMAFIEDGRSIANFEETAEVIQKAIDELDASTLDQLYSNMNDCYECRSSARFTLVRDLLQNAYWEV